MISPRTSHLFRCRQVNDNGFVVVACGSAGSSVTVEIDPQAVKRWIKENWGVAVGLIVGGIVLFFLLRWTYKKKKPAMKSVSDNSHPLGVFLGVFLVNSRAYCWCYSAPFPIREGQSIPSMSSRGCTLCYPMYADNCAQCMLTSSHSERP